MKRINCLLFALIAMVAAQAQQNITITKEKLKDKINR